MVHHDIYITLESWVQNKPISLDDHIVGYRSSMYEVINFIWQPLTINPPPYICLFFISRLYHYDKKGY